MPNRDLKESTVQLRAPKLVGISSSVNVNATSHVSSALGNNQLYRIVADVACFVAQGDNSVVAYTANGHYLPANTFLNVYVGDDEDDNYIAAISSGSGKLYISAK